MHRMLEFLNVRSERDEPGAESRGRRWPLRGTPVAVVCAAVLLLFGGKAWGQWQPCGTPDPMDAPFVGTCTATQGADGIMYWDPVSNGITLKIPGVPESTTTIKTIDDNNADHDSAIFLLEQGPITLEIGTEGMVAITQTQKPANYYDLTQPNQQTSGHGIFIRQPGGSTGSVTVDVRSGVTIGTQTQRMLNNGIFVQMWDGENTADHSVTSGATIYAMNDGIAVEGSGRGKVSIMNTGDVTAGRRGLLISHGGEIELTNSGVIMSGSDTEMEAHGINVNAWGGTSDMTVTNHGDITASGDGIRLNMNWNRSGTGDMTVTNSGAITASGGGIDAFHRNTGDIMITNSGAITAKQFGIKVTGSGNTRVENSGDITVDGDFAAGSLESIGIVVSDWGKGNVVIENSGDITAENWAIFARKNGDEGDFTVTHLAGDVFGKRSSGIHASVGSWDNEGSADAPAPTSTASVTVNIRGGSVKASETLGRVGVEAHNYEGGSVTVNVDPGATIIAQGNAGIWAWLSDGRNTAGRISITQKGTISGSRGIYAQVDRSSGTEETRAAKNQPLINVDWEGTFTQPERDPSRSNNVAHAVEIMQEFQGAEVLRGAQGSAGIDAEVGSWRTVNRIVTGGDDPGESPNPDELLAGSSGNAIIAAFRSTLEDDRYELPASDREAIDTDGTAGYSDSELRTYLMNNPTLLRDVLRSGLSAAERAVLEALWTGGDVEAALNAVPSGYTDEWKTRVTNLGKNYNRGDIRVNVNGGSITSDGDGVRAWYVLPHNNNGDIDVTVADGASVTGDVAGIYVANAGVGADGFAKQTVTVAGTVTGGTDAAVRLKGGGRVTVERTGAVQAGSSGQAIRSDAGNLDVTVAGMVTGDVLGMGEGEHAVDVRRGGTVTGTVRLAGSTVTVGGTVGSVILENSGMVMIASTGRVTGVPEGGHGVRVGDGSTVTNRGTIVGKVGIQTGAGSTVVNVGTIRSTDGPDGVAIRFVGGEEVKDTLTLRAGMTLVGKIQGLSGEEAAVKDTVDLSELDEDEVGFLTFVDEDDTPINVEALDLKRPTRRGIGTFICGGNSCASVDTTAFALADDVLSDLTASIHGAVADRGMMEGRAGSGRPTVWATPFGGARNQNGAGTVADGTHSFGGGLLGTSWGTSTLRVGGFLGGSFGMIDVDSRQDPNVDVQTLFGGLYAQLALGGGVYDARMLVGRMTRDSTRRAPGMETAEAEYHSFFLSPEVGVAIPLKVTDTLAVLPRVRVRYAGLFTNGFQESGKVTGWDLRVEERTIQLLEGRAEVGVPLELVYGGQIYPRVGVEGRWLLSGSEIGLAMGGGQRVRVDAGGDDQVITGTVGIGLSVPVADAMTLVGSFDGALTTEEAWRALGYLGLSYSF